MTDVMWGAAFGAAAFLAIKFLDGFFTGGKVA